MNHLISPDETTTSRNPHPLLSQVVSTIHDALQIYSSLSTQYVPKAKTYLSQHPELIERYTIFLQRIYNSQPLLSSALLNKAASLQNIDGKGSFHAVFIIEKKSTDNLHNSEKCVIKLPISCTIGRFQEVFRPTIDQMHTYMNTLEQEGIIIPTTLYDGRSEVNGLPLYGLLQPYIPNIQEHLVTRNSVLSSSEKFNELENMINKMDTLTQHDSAPMLLDLMGLEAAAKSISYLVHAIRGTLPAELSDTGNFPWENLVYQYSEGKSVVRLMDTIPFPVEFKRFTHIESQHAKALMMGYKRYMIIVFDVLKKEYELRQANQLEHLAPYAQKRVFPELQRYLKDYVAFFGVLLGMSSPTDAKVLSEHMRWFTENGVLFDK